MSAVFEQSTHTAHFAVSVIDVLARALRVGGEFPAPIGDLRFEIVAATAPGQQTFAPPRVLWTFRNRSGYVVLDGTYVDVSDSSRRWPLGPGTYSVRVVGPCYQNAIFTLQWPPAEGVRRLPLPQSNIPDSLELLPGPAYPLPDVTLDRLQLGPTILRGTAFAPDSLPLDGAVAEVVLPILQPSNLPPLGNWPFLKATSSAQGDWAIVLPGRRYIDAMPEVPPNPGPIRKQISLSVRDPAGAVATVIEDVLLGSEHSVRNTALRGQVLGPGGRPIAGAKITTTASSATSLTRSDGVWFLYFGLDHQTTVPNVSVMATIPGGASATDSTATLQPRATVFVPTFRFN